MDDGAIFYLNGTEVARFNMPTNPVVGYDTLAVNGGDAYWEKRTIDPAPWTTNHNVLAVEVHQSSPASMDAVFGAELRWNAIPNDTTTPRLRLHHALGGSLTLSWTNGGTLMEAPALAGPWTESVNQANPQTITISDQARFYRLRD